MKIRIQATEKECYLVSEQLNKLFNVRSVSGFYKNRGKTEDGRVYIDFDFKSKNDEISGQLTWNDYFRSDDKWQS